MDNSYLVSVIIPCYNCEKYIAEAIESILNQSYNNIELIIVDDCSVDNSPIIIKNYLNNKNVVYLENSTNSGVSYSINVGIKIAKGEYIARMDADDISHPLRIQKQVDVMLSNPNYSVIGTNVKVIDGEGNVMFYYNAPFTDNEIRKAFSYTSPIWSGSQMWRKNKCYEVGLFDELIPGCEDLEFTLRLLTSGKSMNIQEYLYTYRKNVSGESNVTPNYLFERITLAREVFSIKVNNERRKLNDIYQKFKNHYVLSKIQNKHSHNNDVIYYYNYTNFLFSLFYYKKNIARRYLIRALNINLYKFNNIKMLLLFYSPKYLLNIYLKINNKRKKIYFTKKCGDVYNALMKLPAISSGVSRDSFPIRRRAAGNYTKRD